MHGIFRSVLGLPKRLLLSICTKHLSTNKHIIYMLLGKYSEAEDKYKAS